MHKTLTTLIASAFVLLTGCAAPPPGDASSSGTVDDDSSVGTPPPSGSTSESTDIEPSSDLRDVRPISWTRARPVDPTHVRIFFTGQNPRCYGWAATVRESSQDIAVTLLEGTLPDAPELCAAVGARLSVVVPTHAPIGSRTIRDPQR